MTAILVAESDPGVCDLVTDLLQAELAAVVRCARTGTLAAEALETEGFDLAIIDVSMPAVSGYELAKRAANNNIPTLLYTGHPDALIKLKEQNFPHLAKPFQLNELVYEAARIITHTAENIRQVKASLVKLQANTAELQADIGMSCRLIAESKHLVVDRPIKI